MSVAKESAGILSSIRGGTKKSLTSGLAIAGASAGVGAAFYDEYSNNTNRNNVRAAGDAAILGGIGYVAGVGLHGGKSLVTGIWSGGKSLLNKTASVVE